MVSTRSKFVLHLTTYIMPEDTKLYRVIDMLDVRKQKCITKFKKTHGDTYSYDKFVYTSMKTKTTITCKIHGDFEQTPDSHSRGAGCKKCANEALGLSKTKSAERFLSEARRVHGGRFDYSKTVYVNSKEKLTIICRTHGEFEQVAGSHLVGHGCRKCADMEVGNMFRTNTIEFISKAQKIHGVKRYLYDKVNYIGNKEDVEIYCTVCEDYFKQSPNNHLTGKGCRFCANNVAMTQEEFLAESREIWGDKYDYSKTIYVNKLTHVTIRCTIHDWTFKQSAVYHLRKMEGCDECKGSLGELLVTEVLKKHNIPYMRELSFEELGLRYKYDFFLHNHNVFIECHGIQHYNFVPHFHLSLEDLHRQQERDKLKENFVKNTYGKYIAIKYTLDTYEKVESYLKPLLDKIGRRK